MIKQHRIFKDQTNTIETAQVDEDCIRLDFILSQYEQEGTAKLTRVLNLENAKRLSKFLDKAIKAIELPESK